MCRVLPGRGAAFFDMGLVEKEGHEGDVPVGPGGKPVEKVLVGIPGERAPVIPGDGKSGSLKPCPFNPSQGDSIPSVWIPGRRLRSDQAPTDHAEDDSDGHPPEDV